MLHARDSMYSCMFLATVVQIFVRQTVHVCMTEHFRCQKTLPNKSLVFETNKEK
jgi:hypothetical protein